MPELPTRPVLSRRALLRGVGALGAAGLLAACGAGSDQAEQTPGTSPQPTPEDVRRSVLEALGVDVPIELSLVVPAAEFVAGEDRRIVFGLATDDREFLSGLDVEVAVVRDEDMAVVSGPVDAAAYEDFGALGVYAARVSYPEPGIYRVAAIADGRAAVGAIQVIAAGDSPVPQVGDEAPEVATPTIEEPGDLDQLCTRDPDCSMHETSLDEALAAGRPIVLTIATPAYCQTAICGPVVDVIEDVGQSSQRDDVAWIHVEVFSDAGNTPTEVVGAYGLPSEPWTFFIDAEGRVADRLEGPTPAELVREGLETI